MSEHFSISPEGGSIEVLEGGGNSFHLGPILRKYTSARMQVKGLKRFTVVEMALLYDALGLLRSLAYDVEQFNAASRGALSPSELRYACFRLTKQASAFGVRTPRPGAGTVDVPGLAELIAFLETRYADEIAAARGLIAGGIADFQSLSELYLPGTDLLDRGACSGLFGVPTAMRVRACYYSRGKSLFGVVSTFYAAVEFIVAVGDKFAVVECPFPISDFPGTRSCNEGLDSFVRLSEEVRRELTERGTRYEGMTSAASYLEYVPGSFLPVPRAGVRAPARARGGGRMMVDSHAAWVRGVHCARSDGVASEAVKGVMKLLAQRARITGGAVVSGADAYTAGSAGQTASAAEEESLDVLLLSAPLPPFLLHLTWPVVAGFSFAAKSWGVAMVSGLKPVAYNEEAFSRLVMPQDRKRLIEALVQSHQGGAKSGDGALKATSTDVMAQSGKGQGTIFLFYGPPGTGKTLTAEAIAEMLHRPLYVVSMGELGTTPEALEERLLDVLDVCTPWGALVLIDEAEMLLEARSKSDIVRNAMVCVMLRLLEYYSGILMLTTNRVESLDPAFQSRVQCALRYASLDAASRERIWEDLLRHTRVEIAPGIDVPGLALHELNGRQIKNALQLAIALCQSEGAPLAQGHLDTTVGITTAFVSELGGTGSSQ